MGIDIIQKELQSSHEVLEKFMQDEEQLNNISLAADIVSNAISEGNKVITCGNGGSHCDAMHFAEELAGKYRDERRPLPAIAISDPSFISCVSNDYGFDQIFSRFVEGVGQPGDVLVAISTSGNSQNVLNAITSAQEKHMPIVGLTGNGGGEMHGRCDVEIRVPHQGYADRIQEVHIKIIHILIHLIEQKSA